MGLILPIAISRYDGEASDRQEDEEEHRAGHYNRYPRPIAD